jgi:hypothetical protein
MPADGDAPPSARTQPHQTMSAWLIGEANVQHGIRKLTEGNEGNEAQKKTLSCLFSFCFFCLGS